MDSSQPGQPIKHILGFQQSHKACLLKMVIGRESFGYT
jgi:hypothetical protein